MTHALVCQGPFPSQLCLGDVEKQWTVVGHGIVGSGSTWLPWGLGPNGSQVVWQLEQEWKDAHDPAPAGATPGLGLGCSP